MTSAQDPPRRRRRRPREQAVEQPGGTAAGRPPVAGAEPDQTGRFLDKSAAGRRGEDAGRPEDAGKRKDTGKREGAGKRKDTGKREGAGKRKDTERGWRELAGNSPSQVGLGGALRARDVARPTAADLAAAERSVVVVRRQWQPPEGETEPGSV